MNRLLPKAVKNFFSARLYAFCILLLVFGEVHSQAVTISAASGGLAASPLPGGITNVAVFGVQLSKDAVAANTVTAISFGLSTDPTGKFTNARLYESTDATFSGVGVETLITTGTLSATNVSFTGTPLTSFDGATTAADNEFFFVVVDVDPSVTGATTAIQPSLTSANVTVSTPGVSGGPLNGTNFSFAVPVTTIANLSTGLAASPLLAGSTGQGVFGFSLTSTGTQTVSAINVQVTSTAVSKWGSYSLITSTDNSFSTTGDNSAPIGGLTFDASSGTQIAITGLSESITTSGKNYFLVVDVNGAVTGATTAVQPSLAAGNVTATPGSVGGSASGTNYSFVAPQITIANLSTGLAASPLVAGSIGQGVFGFSLTSTGTQTVSVINVQVTSTAVSKWGSYSLITSTDNSFATTGDNSAPIGGLTFDASSGTQIAITGLSESITTAGKNYFLVVNVNAAVNAATTAVQPSLVAANITATPGTVTGTATGTNYSFAPLLTIATLSNGLAPSPLIAGSTGQGVFGFSLASSGSQTVTAINVQVTSTAVSKWGTYSLITSTDNSFATTGDNSAPIGGLTFDASSGTQIAITGLSQVITTGTNYFLVVNIDPAVTGATTAIQPTLVAGNITTTGGVAGSATGTNYSFGLASATFAQLVTGIAPSPLSAGVANQAVLGFSAASNSTQTFTAITVLVSSTPASKWGSYSLVRSTDASFSTAGDNTPIGGLTFTPSATQIVITGLSETINSTAKNYFLVVTVDPAVTSSTTAVQPSFSQTNISVNPGNVNAVTVTGTSYAFNTSQSSDIILNGSTTNSIAYEDSQDNPISDASFAGATSLGDYIIRDGGGSGDGDNKATIVTSIELQLTNAENLRQIVLWDDSDDTEIPGTQQSVSGTGTITIVFTPSTPISVPDGGSFEFKTRASFKSVVTDNHAIRVSVVSVTAAATGSGFSPVGTWAPTQTAINTNVIAVVATKFIVNCTPTTQAINAPFTITVQAVDDVFENRDLDYSGKIDLQRSPGGGTFTATQGFTGQSLAAGQFIWTNAQFSVSNIYTITANDNAYDPPAPENQVNLENGQRSITITASSSNITQSTDPVLCYGAAASSEVLSNIIITETDAAGISGSAGSYTFSLSLPSGFVFDQTVTTGVSVGGGADLNTPSGYSYPSANVVEFSFNLTATANINTITISGLKARYPHPGTVSPPPTGVLNITRSGGTANIAGVAPGTVLGTISALQNNPAVDFTVTATVGNIDPNTTSFNVSSPPVNLIGTGTPVGVFSGSGVTPSPNYRFNPNTLAQGTYDITYLQTSASGCQSVAIKTFTVFDSGIGGLNSSYCNNAAPSSSFTVSQTFIDNIFGPGWLLDHYTYYDPFVYYFNLSIAANATVGATYTNNGQTFTVVQTIIAASGGTYLLCSGTGAPLGSGTLTKTSGTGDALISFSYYYNGDFRPITSPTNSQFNPALPAYQTIYNYFGGQIPIGFAVCNGGSVPCNGYSNYGTYNTYQWVTVNPAPNVTFDLPSAFCRDNVPVTLIGSPPNGNNIADDLFTASGGQLLSISHALVSGNEVWTFSPAAVTGEVPFTITYQYKDPVTGCSNTFDRLVTVYDVPTAVPSGDITKSIAGPPSNTTIRLCAGTPVGNFTATNGAYSYNWYADPVGPANIKGVLPTFSPPVDNLVAGITPFYVTRVRNGCESIATPLALSVNVVAAPVAPTPNFNDIPTRQYCVNGSINDAHLGVPGTNVKWYNSVGMLVYSGSFPTAGDLSLSTVAATTYSFNVTQTEAVNSCEGPPTPVNVQVQALPIISIAPIGNPLEICNTAPANLKLTPTDQGNPAPGLSWTIDPSAGTPGVLTNFNGLDGTVELNPLTGTPGTYTLRYTYTNGAGCSNSGTRNVRIFPTVTPSILVGSAGIVCNGFPAIINNMSSINPNTSTISTAEWTFGDGQVVPFGATASYLLPIDPTIHPGITAGTYENPTHIYPNVGTFQLEGRLVTSDGCVYNIPQTPVTVSPLPDANFISENVCVDSQTTFTGSADIPIQTYDWDFAKNNQLAPGTATSTGPSSSASFTYSQTGKDTVRLTATTAAGCQDIVEKPIFIVPNYTPITAASSYTQDFTVNDGWVAGGRNSSWFLGTPTGAPIIGDADAPPGVPSGTAWDTNLSGDNNPDESSWVLSGCFDFTGSVKPVISIDVWSDNQLETDGAVLQYNLTGNIEDDIPNDSDPDGDWEVVGSVGAGINWYDAQGISNSPGNQTSTSAGWTGRYGQWKRAIFKLDPVIGQQKVVLRIAFASLQPRGDGFAFDNIFVGERSRIVLLENFTNSSVTGPPPTTHNNNFKNFGNATELVKIQYHTASPGPDPINSLNAQMHNARTAFYGITEAPTIRIDGDFKNGDLASWAQDLYDDRVLTPAILKLNATAVKDVPSGVVKINTTIENTTNQDIPVANVRIFTTIVEKSIMSAPYLGNSGNTEFVFVAKQMLPSPTGVPLIGGNDPALLEAGEVVNAPEIIWEYPEIWDTPAGSAIVVFVQSTNGNNKNVFQAFFLDNPAEPDDVVTGIEDPAYAEKINLFPNPANHVLNVELPAVVNRETPIVMFDTYGRAVYQGAFKEGEHRKSVNTTELTGGVYIVQIGTPEGGIARRKVMVVHR